MDKKYYIQMLGFAFLADKLNLYNIGLFERTSPKISKNKRYFYENKFPNKKYFSLGKQPHYNKTIPKSGKNKKTQNVYYQAKSRARRNNIREKLEKKCKRKQ